MIRELNKNNDEALLDVLENQVPNSKAHFKTLRCNPNQSLWGVIFEEIIFYVIHKNFSNNFKEIKLGIKIKYNNSPKNQPIDEFDVLMLTNSGEIICIECKTSGIDGDGIKSHTYSTYQTSGIYGTPILCSPLLRAEILNNTKQYQKSLNAAKAAEEAKLKVIAIDELLSEIKKL